jgi:maltoporin
MRIFDRMWAACFRACLFSLPTLLNASEHQPFSFHGYTRGGLLTSEGGTTAAEFAAPGAGAKYRLGNESDVQLRLQGNYLTSAPESGKTFFQAELAIEDYQRIGTSRDFTLNQVPKAWLQAGNLFGSKASVWVGRRWYYRKGSYINDYWWLNSGQKSHVGGGVEGIDLGAGELKVALFQHRDDDALALDDPAITGTLLSRTIDVRYEGLSLGTSGQLGLWALYADREQQQTLGYKHKHGWGIGGWWDHPQRFGGKNTLAITYRSGAAMTQNTYNGEPVRESQGYDLDHSSMWEINNTWLWDDRQDYAVEWVTLARAEDFGQAGSSGDTIHWYSTGARPIFYLSQYWNVATEVGVDYVDNQRLGVSGRVNKASIALQLSHDRGFISPPVVRFFVTYATWSDDLVGLVGTRPGDAPYSDDDHGWSSGVQFEHSW